MSTAREALWESGHDESVEVNQRALIDKVLARYSEEFTVFRELLQNSDDASAKAVEIHFDTEGYLQRSNNAGGDDGSSETSDITPLPDLKTVLVHQWTFKNDGMIFRNEDWNRLKKIAEGNPDEEKIGAFGVGFYSLFSVTEEPFVTSGGQWMGFYWKDKKDQLFARRGQLPSTEGDEGRWTTFTMPLRKPETLPIPFDFIRFLTSSITFMAHLAEISVFFDGKRLARLRKDRGLPKSIGLRKGLRPQTSKKMMRVTDVSVMPLSIKADIMQWVYAAGSSVKPRKRPPAAQQQARQAVTSGFFSSLFSGFSAPLRGPSPNPEPIVSESNKREQQAEEQKKLLQITETGVVLAVFSASVDVLLEANLREELLRATKKNAPTKMRYELIYTGKDEYDASIKEEHGFEVTGSIFQGLRADIDGTGSARIFIGHSTRQTTGIGGHMSARFIPTVERESVDLVDRNVRVWNEELLGVGGYLARTAYEQEMENITTLWQAADGFQSQPAVGSITENDSRPQLRQRALHALKFYTFHTSTPSPRVATLLEEAFFTCIAQPTFSILRTGQPDHPFPIISTVGIRSAADVRMPNTVFAEFLKELPVLPEDVLSGAATMVEVLRTRGMIKDVMFGDVLSELKRRPLTEHEMTACFKWWLNMYKTIGDAQLQRARSEIINAAILTIGTPGGSDEKIISLVSLKTFLNTRSTGAAIPTDGPLPSHVLPLTVSRHFDPQALRSAFGWQELTVADWLGFLLDPQTVTSDPEHDLTSSTHWADRVLQVLARVWPSCGKEAQADVVTLLQDKTCIPTSAGLKVPGDAYFQNAHVFPDLPLVTFPSGAAIKGNLEKVLQALGVRKHVELQIVFNRMIRTGDWSIADLTKYLVAVQSTLTSEELERLRLTPAFPREQVAQAPQSQGVKVARLKASDLYEPLDIFRDLGLPVIDWGLKTKWRSSSEEAKFLHQLGLRTFPPLDVILALAAGPDEKIRSIALQYFLDNHGTRYTDYRPSSYTDLAFIPALKGKTSCMGKPGEVFSSSIWATMGFLVTRPSLGADAINKIGVQEHPPTARLVSLLERTPPESVQIATEWFSAMATRIVDFSNKDLERLSQLLIVPIETTSLKVDDKGKQAVRLVAPSHCFFKKDAQAQVHSKLFTFVDFGKQANQFLSVCGTKHEPTVEEIAQILLENPHRFWELADSNMLSYLIELRNIAVNKRLLSSVTVARMKRSPVLLGMKRKKRSNKAGSQELEEEDGWDYEYDLLQPSQVIIADDTNGYQLFGDKIFTCPQEDLLEEFYYELGSRRLSSMVKEDYETSAEIRNTRKADELRARILERLPLFLHEHTHAATRVPFSWLNSDRNFVVRVFHSVTVKKSLTYGNLRLVEKQDSSASALREGRGPIQLWLANNVDIDMFEVSTSICRLLFSAPKASDALLFMTILSTDLKALRRRGYNVDRILQKQKIEERAAEDAARERAKQVKLASQPTPTIPSVPPTISMDTRPTSPPLSVSSAGTEATLAADGHEQRKSLTQSMRGPLSNWKRKLIGHDGIASQPPSSQPVAESTENAPLLAPPRPSPSRPVTPGSHVTPLRNIETNINMAIRACKEERSETLKSRSEMHVVKESLNDSYCDVSGNKDLTFVGSMGDFKVFMAKDVQQPKEVMTSKREAIARTSHLVLVPPPSPRR